MHNSDANHRQSEIPAGTARLLAPASHADAGFVLSANPALCCTGSQRQHPSTPAPRREAVR
ncbi:hypothetical protein CBM2586_U10017 [Cupriavidus phytorum]|uniref:Uncharacterized protein n=1 Tax=Cupriavidus taiwanensis TaxID=164546 RepID=A0A375CT58_9BURK|nr:hypothetical protein CBM2586_U10017 [Cupriavidus taiwanensis]